MDLYSIHTCPTCYPAGPVGMNPWPAPLFMFNEMLSDYNNDIVAGVQLTNPRTWGVLGYNKWYRGPSANPQFVNYYHAWAYHTVLPYVDQPGTFDLASLYGANTKIKTSITNLRQVFTPTITGMENPYDHIGDLVFEVYDDSSPLFRGDFDGSATCDTGDLFSYLNCYFCGSLSADMDNDLNVDVGDLFNFLDCWFEGMN
jgi:hypothetical protein